MAPPAGFNSTMQLPKRQLNKIIVLVEFVIHSGLRTQSVYRNSYLTIATFIETSVCACVHTRWFFLPHRDNSLGTSFCKTSTLCNIKKAESTDRRAASASGEVFQSERSERNEKIVKKQIKCYKIQKCRGVILTPCPCEIFTTNFDIHCAISREIVKVKTKSLKFSEVTGGNTIDIDCENRNEESQIHRSSEKVYRNIIPHG